MTDRAALELALKHLRECYEFSNTVAGIACELKGILDTPPHELSPTALTRVGALATNICYMAAQTDSEAQRMLLALREVFALAIEQREGQPNADHRSQDPPPGT